MRYVRGKNHHDEVMIPHVPTDKPPNEREGAIHIRVRNHHDKVMIFNEY